MDATWSFQPTKKEPLDFDYFISILETLSKTYNNAHVYHDGREGNAITSALLRKNIKSHELSTGRAEQTRRANIASEMFATNAIRLVDDQTLISELKTVLATEHADKSITVGAKRRAGFQDALTDCLLLAAGELRTLEKGAQKFRPGGDIRKAAPIIRGLGPDFQVIDQGWERRHPDGEWRPCPPPSFSDRELDELLALGYSPVIDGQIVKPRSINVSFNLEPKTERVSMPVATVPYKEIITPDDGFGPDAGMFLAPNNIRYMSRQLAQANGHENLKRITYVQR